jgi:transcriptional regulator with XRE-family HTH domain
MMVEVAMDVLAVVDQYAELHRNYIGLLERAEQSPSLETIVALARALGMRPSEMLMVVEVMYEQAPSPRPSQ